MELDKERIPYPFDEQRFLVIKGGFVFILEPIWLNLQGIGIDLSSPEPLCAAELDVFCVDKRDVIERLTENPARCTVLDTEGDVCDPVLHAFDRIGNRQGFQVMWIHLMFVDEMTITALKCEAIRQVVKAVYKVDDGGIQHVIA